MADDSKKRTIQKLKELLQLGEDFSKKLEQEDLKKNDVRIQLLDEPKATTPDFSDLGYTCETEEEFDERMLLRITGSDKLPFIVLDPLRYTESQLAHKKAERTKDGHAFIIPTVVTPNNPRDPKYQFTPYIVFFTHDAKLFLYPADGSGGFSDQDLD